MNSISVVLRKKCSSNVLYVFKRNLINFNNREHFAGLEKNEFFNFNPISFSKCRSYKTIISKRHATTLSKVPVASTFLTKDEKRDFMAVFPDLVRDLTSNYQFEEVPDATKRFKKVLQYNVPNGKKNRGLTTVLAYRMLADPKDLTPENIRLSQILGWCLEIMQAFFIVADDYMDQSITRRGRPCWYKNPEIGISAINDALLLDSATYLLLKKYFKDKPYYSKLVENFLDVSMKTKMGQCIDVITPESMKYSKLDKFTMELYNSIVKFKTAYYSFVLPVKNAMYMVGIEDQERHRQAKTILLEIGQFFQIQDDYMDCFGDPEVTGKIGTDIEEGKCSWLIVVALQRANNEQRNILEDCYASSDPEKVKMVKNIYEELSLPATYATYEEESYNLIQTHIQQLSSGLNHDLFFKLLNKIYKRNC